MIKNNSQIVDRLGIFTSGICALHCAFLPVLFSLGILGGMNTSFHGTIELFVIPASAFLGIWSIYNGLKHHGQLIPQFLIAFGAFIIILGFFSEMYNHIIMAIGGCLLLIGHWNNWRQFVLKD